MRYWDANPLTRPSPPYPHRHTIHHTPPASLSSPSWARVRATSSVSAVVPENSGGDIGANSRGARVRLGLYGLGARNGNNASGEQPSDSIASTRANNWTEGTQGWLTAPTRFDRTPWNDSASDENEDDGSEIEESMRSSSMRASLAFNERLNSSIFNESDDDLGQEATTTASSSSNTSYREAIPLPPRTSVFGVDSQTRQLPALSPPIDGWFDSSSRASRTSSYSFSQIETFRRATESLQRDIRSLRSQVAATQASFAAQRSSTRYNTDDRRMALEQHLQRLQLLERHHTRSAVNLMEAQVQNVRRQQEQQRQQQQQVQHEFRQRIIQQQQLQHQTRSQSAVNAPSTSLPLSLSETVSIFTSNPRSTMSLPPLSNAASMPPYRPRVTPNALPSPPSAHSSSPQSPFTLGSLIQPRSSRTSSPTIVSNANAQDEPLSSTQRSRPPLSPSFSSSSSFSTSSSFSSSSPFTSGSFSRSFLSRAGSWSSRDSEQGSGAEGANDSTRHDLQASSALPSITDTLTRAATTTEASTRTTLADSVGLGSSTLRGTEGSQPDSENYPRPSAEDYDLFTALSQRRRQQLREAMETAEGLRTSVERRRIVMEDRDHRVGEPSVELLLSDDSLPDPVGGRQSTIFSSAPLTPGPLTSGLEAVGSSLAESEAIAMLTPVSTSRSTVSPEPTDQ